MQIARGISVTNLSKPISTAAAFDADAVAFFTAASITNTTQKNAVNQLVLDLKSASIWTKMKALYPVVGGVASAHAVNLKTPGTYNLTFATGWTHSSTGMTPNGATYANTNLVPNSILSLNSVSVSYYSRTTTTPTDLEMMLGIDDNKPPPSSQLNLGMGTGYMVSYLNDYTFSNTSINTYNGLFMGNRQTSTIKKLIRNGVLLSTATINSLRLNSYSLFLGAASVDGTALYRSNRECAFASIGDGLTDAEASSFYTAVQTFQTTLNRQIP